MSNVAQERVRGNHIFCAIDLHQRTMLAGIALDQGPVQFVSLDTDDEGGVAELIGLLHEEAQRHPGSQVWVSYEASGCGFRLADFLAAEGFGVSVLAPSHLPVSLKKRSFKTDKRDVIRILEVLRGHVLAGNDLPAVWIPSPELRDDREIVRRRLDLRERGAEVKNKIHGLLRRYGIKRPAGLKTLWSRKYVAWLRLTAAELEFGAATVLLSLLRELDFYLGESESVEAELVKLAESAWYQAAVEALTRIKGVGVLTAMVFLTELGDMDRFGNRRQVSSYFGLVPRSYESGEHNDHKGHISRMGPARVRKVLNQAAWSLVRWDESWREWFQSRTRGGNKDRRKKMITAVMRKLGVRMWHAAQDAA